MRFLWPEALWLLLLIPLLVALTAAILALARPTASVVLPSQYMKDDIYAFIFSQQGLMAGLGLQGNKITKINPK